eukprot:479452-Amorphochlora_amoeboformis.AAC.1
MHTCIYPKSKTSPSGVKPAVKRISGGGKEKRCKLLRVSLSLTPTRSLRYDLEAGRLAMSSYPFSHEK